MLYRLFGDINIVIIIELSNSLAFFITLFEYLRNLNGYIIKDNSEFNYCAMLNIMNSQILWWYLKHTGTVLANGYFRYKPTYLKDFPLPLINKSEMEKLSSLNQHDKTSDRFIGLLFGLDDNDIDFVSRT